MGFMTLVNGRFCREGELVEDRLVISEETGLIVRKTGQGFIGGDAVDLDENIVAPGFLDLQMNGMLGFHFAHHNGDDKTYAQQVDKLANSVVRKGVTGFWATVPTMDGNVFQKILPCLKPREIEDGASLLGSHVNGPFLHPSQKGAYDSRLFCTPSETLPEMLYGDRNLQDSVKLVTLAPELDSSEGLIKSLTGAAVRVSLGHSSASYDMGCRAMQHGATSITNVFNAMSPLHDRSPGLAGLISSPGHAPFYSMIPDGTHLHPATLNMAYRANPRRSILVTNSVELSGLVDGTYPGHSHLRNRQTKTGCKVVVEGTETLVGSCIGMDEGIRNLMRWSGCSVAEAVRCATENVASSMGLVDRGKLEEGRRADFVVLDEEGEILQTWIRGKKVFDQQS